ncbi:MAG: GAF domain-containing sensor histidine kinase [Acidimicrobiales bacterium]
MASSSAGFEGSVGSWPDKVQTLLGAALELSGEHELETVLRRIVAGAATIADARYAALGIFDDGGDIEAFIHHGMDDATVARIGSLPQGRGLLGEVIVASGPIRLDDLGTASRSGGFPPNHPPMRTFLGVPVGRSSRRYGNLYLTEKAGGAPFDEEDEALVVAFAAFAVGAIESARLVQAERARAQADADLAAATERATVKREMLGGILAAQEAERARVSRDLHDDVGQALTSVLLALRLVESCLAGGQVDLDDARQRTEDVRDLVADALRRARQLAFDLRPTVLDDIGLLAALERLALDTTSRGDANVELATDGLADARLPPEVETVVYRVVQEALTNVIRHAGAPTASVTVIVAEGRVRALVEDDGVGFDPDVAPTRGHLGVKGMAERADLMGGSLQLSSAPGAGTTVLLEVPLG